MTNKKDLVTLYHPIGTITGELKVDGFCVTIVNLTITNSLPEEIELAFDAMKKKEGAKCIKSNF